jgi:hypothetical protein
MDERYPPRRSEQTHPDTGARSGSAPVGMAFAVGAVIVATVCVEVLSWLVGRSRLAWVPAPLPSATPHSPLPPLPSPGERGRTMPLHAHEESDADTRLVIGAVIGLLLVLAGCAAASAWLLSTLSGRPIALGPGRHEVGVQAPATLAGPPSVGELRREEEHVLTSYAWVDRRAGIVQIPIERAMDLLAARGLPGPRYAGSGEEPRPLASASGRFPPGESQP